MSVTMLRLKLSTVSLLAASVFVVLGSQTDDVNLAIVLGDCLPSLPRTAFVKPYLDVCLEFVDEEVTWADARTACRDHRGDLAIIKDQDKQQFVVNTLKAFKFYHHRVWIGATDMDQEGVWKWVDGSKVVYGNWHPGEGPAHGFLFARGIEDCALIDINDDGRWYDYDCGVAVDSIGLLNHLYICEYQRIRRPSTSVISTMTSSSSTTTTSVRSTSVMLSTLTGTPTPPTVPSSVTSVWNDVITTPHDRCTTPHTDAALTTPYNGLCLSFVVSSKSWKDADGQCRQHGGLLVEIHNQQDQDFIYDSLRSLNRTDAKCWIGATDRQTEGDWRWSDGSPVTYGQWKPGTGPSHTATNSNCALISVDDGGMWSDYGCDAVADHQVYVCQYPHSST